MSAPTPAAPRSNTNSQEITTMDATTFTASFVATIVGGLVIGWLIGLIDTPYSKRQREATIQRIADQVRTALRDELNRSKVEESLAKLESQNAKWRAPRTDDEIMTSIEEKTDRLVAVMDRAQVGSGTTPLAAAALGDKAPDLHNAVALAEYNYDRANRSTGANS